MPFKKTILLGVVGDSAAGKTTFSEGVAQIIGPERVTVICTDDYHRHNRQQRKVLGLSALNPACNYLDILEQHLDLLRRGHPILKPVYNHTTGDFEPPEYVEPREFIIAEGLLGFGNKALRRHFDVKVFLAPEEELRFHWKIKRDTTKRGYSTDEVLASLARRGTVSKDFIEPQQAFADIVVRFYRPADRPQETGPHLNARLTLRPTLPHPDLSELVECEANAGNGRLRSTIRRQDDRLEEDLEIDGQIGDPAAIQFEELIWRRLQERNPSLRHLRPEQMGAYLDGSVPRQSHPLALAQLLIAYHLLLAREELKADLQEKVTAIQI